MLKTIALLALALTLAGCATPRSLDNDVSTYSQWPAERKPSTYAFERLPSQQARAEEQQTLEDAARGPLETAGFTPAADAASADVNVQLGARISSGARWPYESPIWWQGGLYHRRGAFGYSIGFGGPGLGFRWAEPLSYDREVAVLLRDRQSGQAVFEARASNNSNSASFNSVLPAMFAAALKDFPSGGVNPRRVTVDIAKP
jgi:predicted small secreted protein